MKPLEGITRFEVEHRPDRLPAARFAELASRLMAWREGLYRLGVIGQDPGRYEGAGFGNVSARVGPYPGPRGARAFLITGTQTGLRPSLGLCDFCLVTAYDAGTNRVQSHGSTPPSSESMTHGALYDLGPHIRAVFHAHCPELWRSAARLSLPVTRPTAGYGTPEMAWEVQRLYRETGLSERRVLAMGGHEDGVIAFGRTLEEAGSALVLELAGALGRRPTER